MEIMSCLTTLGATVACLLAIFGVATTDFAKLFSKVLDFKFKEVSFDLVRLIPVPVAALLVFTLTVKEVSVGNKVVAKVVSCDSDKVKAASTCSLCSLTNTLASK